MENLHTITKSSQLNEIFEKTQDKLIVLMFYTKNNPDCRKARSAFDRSAVNNTISQFCLIDMDKFEGDSRYTRGINNMPWFDFYHLGNKLASTGTYNDKELENYVKSAQQYVMRQTQMKNNSANGGNNSFMNGFNPSYNQSNPINPAQVSQDILNYYAISNPQAAQQLLQNPQMLQQLTQQRIQQLQMQQMPNQIPNQMPNQIPNQMPNLMPNQMPNLMPPLDPSNSKIMEVLPTFQQMQQMFQIFQMMQQMGLINSSNNPVPDLPQTAPTLAPPPAPTPPPSETTIELPNGDKLIPLPGGKYGLVKKN